MKMCERIFGVISKHNAECALFLDTVSRRYVSGFESSDGAAIVSGREVVLILDSRYYESALAAGLDGCVRVVLSNRILETVREELTNGCFKRILFDSARMYVNTLEKIKSVLDDGFELVGVADPLAKLRAVKTEEEISAIRSAQKITDAAFAKLISVLNGDMTENCVAYELDSFIRRAGAVNAFSTIAVSGIRSALPHGVPTENKITRNSFLTTDFGACYKGYCSDMTRTVVLGKADTEMKRMYEAVINARKAAFALIKPGVRCADVDKAARDVIDGYGYGKYFQHSTGHSLGLEIHELPTLSSRSEDVLEENVIVTVEPGVYIPGYCGVRVEDMILVTADGALSLTGSSDELLEI